MRHWNAFARATTVSARARGAPSLRRDWKRCHGPVIARQRLRPPKKFPSTSPAKSMNTPTHHVLFSAEGFSARPELLVHAEEKAGKLVHHHSMHGHRLVRLHVKHERPHSSAPRSSVC